MPFVEIFYNTFWISAISIVWFYTDVVIHYAQLLEISEDMILEYLAFITENPDRYFPDYLYQKSLSSDDTYLKFLGKLISCPFCLIGWLSLFASLLSFDLRIAAPVYVLSLAIVLQIKKML